MIAGYWAVKWLIVNCQVFFCLSKIYTYQHAYTTYFVPTVYFCSWHEIGVSDMFHGFVITTTQHRVNSPSFGNQTIKNPKQVKKTLSTKTCTFHRILFMKRTPNNQIKMDASQGTFMILLLAILFPYTFPKKKSILMWDNSTSFTNVFLTSQATVLSSVIQHMLLSHSRNGNQTSSLTSVLSSLDTARSIHYIPALFWAQLDRALPNSKPTWSSKLKYLSSSRGWILLPEVQLLDCHYLKTLFFFYFEILISWKSNVRFRRVFSPSACNFIFLKKLKLIN